MVASVRDLAGNAGSATQTLTVELNPAPVALGTASTYSVLAAMGASNLGPTTLSGDLGVSPAGTISGFGGLGEGAVAGTTHLNDASSARAMGDMITAYNDVAARIPRSGIAGDLNGQIFRPGVYHAAAAISLAAAGTITLDGEGNPNAVFIFQIGAALSTGALSSINLVNGATAANVFWQVLGAASTGAGSSFSGTMMAQGNIALGLAARLTGRALSTSTVALATNTVTSSSP
ncbi:MAG: DUF3494 domain-containing protein [Frankiales bacterium]|nr:DUF3494 domain-containing protein [Frankiales bacterium]